MEKINIETDEQATPDDAEFVVNKVKIITNKGSFIYNFSSFLPEIEDLRQKIDIIYDYLFDISGNNI